MDDPPHPIFENLGPRKTVMFLFGDAFFMNKAPSRRFLVRKFQRDTASRPRFAAPRPRFVASFMNEAAPFMNNAAPLGNYSISDGLRF